MSNSMLIHQGDDCGHLDGVAGGWLTIVALLVALVALAVWLITSFGGGRADDAEAGLDTLMQEFEGGELTSEEFLDRLDGLAMSRPAIDVPRPRHLGPSRRKRRSPGEPDDGFGE